jgi:hypothetical protein
VLAYWFNSATIAPSQDLNINTSTSPSDSDTSRAGE